MITIVGLGNPDIEYKDTRHNVGRLVGEFLHSVFALPDWKIDKKKMARVSKGDTSAGSVEIILPEVYMNISGKSVAYMIGSAKKIEHMVVIHDDLDMPIGRAKMVFNRGSGGHKGIESIARAVKSKAFVRIKIGISKMTPSGKIKKPKGEEAVRKYVLGKFSPDDMKVIKTIEKGIVEALEVFMTDGRAKAQTMFNERF